MISSLLIVSLSSSLVIALALVLNRFIDKRYMARGKYIFWLVLAVRLLIPFNFSLPAAPVKIAAPERTVAVAPSESGPPVTVIRDSELGSPRGMTVADSAAYVPIMPLERLLTLIWAAGAALLFMYQLVKYWLFRLAVRPCLTREGEYRGLPVYRCGAVESPMMTGFFRPMILLPEAELTPGELDMVFAHEYVHFRRRDLWYKLLLTAANAVHWFNPLVYLMVRQANRDMEYSCDDAVTRGRDLDFRKRYSMTILKTMKQIGGKGGDTL